MQKYVEIRSQNLEVHEYSCTLVTMLKGSILIKQNTSNMGK